MKIIKKLSLLLTVTVISILCLAMSSSAAWEKVNEEGDIEYHFDEVTGTMYFRGEGKIEKPLTGLCENLNYDDYYDEDIYDEDYSDLHEIKTIIIEEGITEIGHCAFMGNLEGVNGGNKGVELLKNLETVVLPDSLEVIEEYAFLGCNNLTKVYFSDNLKTIGKYAFYNTGVKQFTVPETLETIGANAFYGTNLKKVYVPENVKEIGTNAFGNCDSLKKITFTKASCYINDCENLTKIVYPETPKYVGVIAENCANLKEVVFNNITSKNKVKIAAEDVGVFLPGCPNAELGHMDESVVSALNSSYTTKYVDYAIITPTVNKKVGLVESFRCEQRNSTKLLWRSVPNIGYYQVYYYKNGKWERIYSGSGCELYIRNPGKYRIRAVSYDGKTRVYGKYSTVNVKLMSGVGSLTAKGTTLKWTKDANAGDYQIFYSKYPDCEYKKLVTTKNTSYNVSKKLASGTYYFKVRSHGMVNDYYVWSQFSDYIKVIVP